MKTLWETKSGVGHSDGYTTHQNRSKDLMGVVEKKAEMEVLFSTLIWTHWLFSLIPPQQSAALIGFSFLLPLLLPLLTA